MANKSANDAALEAQRDAIEALPPRARLEVKACAKALRAVADFYGVDVAVEALRVVTLENEVEAEF